ncbi:MAG: hypothetical protein AAF149_22915, partial [Bacteroidota bacterium]
MYKDKLAVKYQNFLLVVLLFGLNSLNTLRAQVTIEAIDFETITGVNYVLNNAGTPNADDYFNVFDNANEGSVFNLAGAITGPIQGSFYLAGKDIDVLTNPNWVQNLNGVDVTQYTNLQVVLSLATTGSGYDGNIGTTDMILIQYEYDGGGFIDLIQFAGTGSGTMSIDNDANDTGDNNPGEILTNTFTDFTFNVPKTGTLLKIRVDAITTGGDEDVVIDNIRIRGTDTTPPVVSAPTNTAQTLRGNIASTSTVQSDELSDIYLVLNGQPATTLGQLTTAVGANNAFIGQSSAVANTPYTVTPPATLNDGVYDIVAVDPAGNVSSILAGWLTVDNTDPTVPAALNLANADDTGSSNTDNITQTLTGLTINGTGENGSTVTLTSNVDGAL